MRYKNEIDNRYGKLVVIGKFTENSKSGNSKWVCECDCGNHSITQGASLRNGSTKSCGCNNGGIERSGEAIFKNSFRLTRSQSLKRNIPFELTIEEYKSLMLGDCSYCGRKPYNLKYAYHKTSYRLGKHTDESLLLNGIDKIEPSKGYVFENCVSCCKYCNRAKSDLSVNQFKELIKLIYLNLKLNGE